MSVTLHAEPECTEVREPGVELDIRGRIRDLGDGFTVRRILPAAARKMVGPFIFLDHMGPVRLTPGTGLDVRPHPHINLATLTYLFEGEILHRDSLGSEQVIRPGEVNWMTAGRGITHSERSPAVARKSGALVHGLQMWVALPSAGEEVEPSFQHHRREDIPTVELERARVRVVAGAAFGVTSPVEVSSPLFHVDVELAAGGAIEPPAGYAERAAYVIDGRVTCAGAEHEAGTMIILRDGARAPLRAHDGARVVMIGGAPLDGERFIWWNFVSSSRLRIEQAKAAWRERRFPLVVGDTHEFIPLPHEDGQPR